MTSFTFLIPEDILCW